MVGEPIACRLVSGYYNRPAMIHHRMFSPNLIFLPMLGVLAHLVPSVRIFYAPTTADGRSGGERTNENTSQPKRSPERNWDDAGRALSCLAVRPDQPGCNWRSQGSFGSGGGDCDTPACRTEVSAIGPRGDSDLEPGSEARRGFSLSLGVLAQPLRSHAPPAVT